MNAVRAVYVGEAGRAEHDAVALGRAIIAMRGRLAVVVGLDFNDYPPDAVDQKHCSDQIGSDLVHRAIEEGAGEARAHYLCVTARNCPSRATLRPPNRLYISRRHHYSGFQVPAPTMGRQDRPVPPKGLTGSAADQPEKTMALPEYNMRQLLEAGVHFGHQAHRWNPKMGPYIFGTRNNIHIIDLAQAVPMLHHALQAVSDAVAKGGHLLFVGTKRQAQDAIADAAKRCAQYYVNSRWLGGTLTNWKTISGSIGRLGQIDQTLSSGEAAGCSNTEGL